MRRSRLLLSGVAAAVLGAFTAACTATDTRESAGEYVDSSVISNKVRAAIVKDPQLSLFNIDVTTFRDVVQLNGFVNTEAEKQRAADVARQVEGVRQVQNNLQIKPPARG
jgi:osmotically-inducible protein OsmY